jgi:CDP-diacylglycerol---glycerol-3-phosphate 3-phosphatidyltransferase
MKNPSKKGTKIKAEVKKIEQEIKDEIVLNVPNALSLLRLILSFLIVYLIFSHDSKWFVVIVFAIAAITDYFDGMLARKLKQTTNIGARLDQVVDRVFAIMVVGALMLYSMIYSHEETVLLFLVMSREIIASPGFVIRIIRNVDSYKVKYIGKVTTFVQSIAIGLIIIKSSLAFYLVIITCILGIIAGLDYLRDSLKK